MENFDGNIKPIHTSPQPVGSSSTSDNFFNFYDLSEKAYQTLVAVGNDSSQDQFETSSYQVILETASAQERSFTEVFPISDTFSFPTELPFDETVVILDSACAEGSMPESFAMQDTLATDAVIYFDEYVLSSDALAQPGQELNLAFGVTVRVLQDITAQNGTIVKIKQDINAANSITINSIEENNVAVTNATAVGNIFDPTAILSGTNIYGPPVPGQSVGRCAINTDCEVITGTSLSDVFDWSVNLGISGGTFSIRSRNQIGVRGQQISVFGLLGVITEPGRFTGNSGEGYITDGIFGTPAMDKQLQLVVFGDTEYTPLLPSQTIRIADSVFWKTVADAARGIAARAGISLQWLANDAPLADFFPEDGAKIGSVLASLAQRVGAQLRWNGASSYSVAAPDHRFGYTTFPDCCFITDISYADILNLETTAGNTILILPKFPIGNPGQSSLNENLQNTQGQPNPEIISTLSTNITSDNVGKIIPLPNNYDTVYISIKTPSDSAGNYVTTGTLPVFEQLLNTATNTFITNIDIGGSLRPVVIMDHNLLPQENNDVTSDNFACYIAATTRSLAPDFEKQQKALLDRQREILGSEQDRYRYAKYYRGNILGIFFGAIPLAGFYVTATIGDLTVEGIAQSVTFASPGTLTIEVAKWRPINLLSQKINLEA